VTEKTAVVEKFDLKDFAKLVETEQAYLKDIGEEPMEKDAQDRLREAIAAGRIVFFAAKAEGELVGMCSIVTAFSTFACRDNAVLEDFYVAPEYRKKGVARLLINAAAEYCGEIGASGITACCAPCDEKMYNSLGFDIKLGSEFVMPLD